MTPFEELRALGGLGPIGYAWLKKMVRQIARANGFPPPPGHTFWVDDACADWLDSAYLKRGKDYVVNLGVNAVDDRSYTAIVRKSVKNEFVDGARGTTEGKLRLRLRPILTKLEEFRDFTSSYGGTPAWTLSSLGDDIWSGDWEDLRRLPGLKSIPPIAKLNEGGPTSAANKESLVGAARVILVGAGGALTDLTLARVLVKVFDLDDVDPYLLGDEQIAQEDNLFDVVDQKVDRDNGWSADHEYSAPTEWLDYLREAEELLAELPDSAKRALSTLDIDALDDVGTEVRAAIKRLNTSRQAVLIVISKCAQMRFDE